MRFVKPPLILAMLFTLTSAQISHASERIKVDLKSPMVAGITQCTLKDQLDCIEAINVITANGRRIPAKQISFSNESDRDENDQIVESGLSTWLYTTASGATNSFSVISKLFTPSYVISGEVTSVDGSTGITEEEESEEDSKREKVDVDSRYFEPRLTITPQFQNTNAPQASKKLASNESLEIIVRTSWLEVDEAMLPGKESKLKITKISGGNLLTMSGKETLIYRLLTIYDTKIFNFRNYVDAYEDFEFKLDHPKLGSTNCSDTGFLLRSTNGSSLDLSENSDTQELIFLATGYPYDLGKVLRKGFAHIRVDLPWIACKFPDSDFPFADSVLVSVSTTDGSSIKQSGVKIKSSVSNGILEVLTEDIYFADTEISIKVDPAQVARGRESAKTKAADEAKAEAEAKAKAEADARAKAEAEAKSSIPTTSAKPSKKTSITCKKGKVTKKVKAANAKCPKGFKKI